MKAQEPIFTKILSIFMAQFFYLCNLHADNDNREYVTTLEHLQR